MTASCNNKVSQCHKIIEIANRVVKETKDLAIERKKVEEADLNNWLTAANTMEKAAKEINSLNISDVQLLDYRSSFVKIYQINSQATYKIIKARKDRDIAMAKAAQDRVKEIGKLEKEVSSKFNSYCRQQ
jgi:hypothetical protein